MTALLTLIALPPVIWAADRFFFNGELMAMVRAEARIIFARRGHASNAPRTARRGFGVR